VPPAELLLDMLLLLPPPLAPTAVMLPFACRSTLTVQG
jgi:hypothetical protein